MGLCCSARLGYVQMTGDVPTATKDLVIRAISMRPGATQSQLVRLTGCSAGSIDHAVYKLVREGILKEQRLDGGPSYWLADLDVGPGFRLQGAPLRFFNAVHTMGGGSLKEIAEHLGLSVPEASKLGKALVEKGLIYSVKMGRQLCFLPGIPKAH